MKYPNLKEGQDTRLIKGNISFHGWHSIRGEHKMGSCQVKSPNVLGYAQQSRRIIYVDFYDEIKNNSQNETRRLKTWGLLL